MYNTFQQPDPDQLHVHEQLGRRRRRDVQRLQQPDPDQLHVHEQLGRPRGGGMYNYSSSPTLTNCTFTGNSAEDDGGGMYNNSSSPTLTDCTFTNNSADSGGGMYNSMQQPDPDQLHVHGQLGRTRRRRDVQLLQQPDPDQLHVHGATRPDGRRRDGQLRSSSPTLTDCTFTGNSAESIGGGMYNRLQQPDPDQLHVHEQLGRLPAAGCTTRLQQPDPDQLHVHEQLGLTMAAGCTTPSAARP